MSQINHMEQFYQNSRKISQYLPSILSSHFDVFDLILNESLSVCIKNRETSTPSYKKSILDELDELNLKENISENDLSFVQERIDHVLKKIAVLDRTSDQYIMAFFLLVMLNSLYLQLLNKLE